MPTSAVEVEAAAKTLAADRWQRLHSTLKAFGEQSVELQEAWVESARVDLTVALPAIEDSCRKRWEEERKALVEATQWLLDSLVNIERSGEAEAMEYFEDAVSEVTAALQATREGEKTPQPLRRERATQELLELAKLADDDKMRDELEGLASRFSLPPREGGSDV